MDAFLLSFGVIFLAELGDKSQLMALAFASRYRATTVLLAVTLAPLLVHAGSVALGAVVAVALPTALIAVLAGVAFLAAGAVLADDGHNAGLLFGRRFPGFFFGHCGNGSCLVEQCNQSFVQLFR